MWLLASVTTAVRSHPVASCKERASSQTSYSEVMKSPGDTHDNEEIETRSASASIQLGFLTSQVLSGSPLSLGRAENPDRAGIGRP